jgi:predicted alpha/beta superfamily hydrolase
MPSSKQLKAYFMSAIYKMIFFVLMMLGIVSPAVNSRTIDPQPLSLEAKDNVIGMKFTIASKILAENRDIQIYLPENYDANKQDYPVLYILDGQRLFTLGVSLAQSSRSTVKMTPEFIVVGINNKYPDRFSNFTKTSWLEFIEQELIPVVDKNYRTSSERILFGWEFGGAFAIESLISKPTLFSGHISASPFPIDETWFAKQSRIEQLESMLEKNLKSHLYITVSEGEGSVIEGTEKLNTLLKEKAPDSLRWTYRVIPEEQHLTSAHATLYQGLKNYFYGYAEFQIDSLTLFEKAGGLNNFYAYNKIRAERFGFSEKPTPWSMFTIVRNAIRADNFQQFERFMNEFKLSNMIAEIGLRDSNWVAQYYLENKQDSKAIEVYKTMAAANPDNARIQHELGNIYLAMNNKNITKMYYQKAVELAEMSKDARLAEYKKDLQAL